MFKVIKVIFLSATLLLTHTAFAASAELEELKKFLRELQDEELKVERSLFQDMKNLISLTELKRIETDNVLRLMLPPAFDTSVTLGARVAAAQETLTPFQESLVRDTADYNMNTPEKDSNTNAFLKERKQLANDDLDLLQDPTQDALNDLLATTLLSGHAFKDDKQANDAYQYIRHLTNFTPIAALKHDEIYNKDGTFKNKGKNYLMQLYKQLPSMTMAQNSLLTIHAEKQRFAELAQGLQVGENNSASLMEVMAYEVERRYMDKTWYDQMNQTSEAGLLKEIANMMAFQNYLDFKRYEQGQRTEAMIAAQMGVLSGIMHATVPDTEALNNVPGL